MAKRPQRRRTTKKQRRPASLWRPRKPITPEIKKRRELAKVIEKPEYIDGLIKWKGLDITIEEARAFTQALSRTPVSRGRFPTEADLIINAVFGESPDEIDFSNVDPLALQKMEQWKNNYLKALSSVAGLSNDEDIQNAYDDLYWSLVEMPLETFVKAMHEHDEELSVIFDSSPKGKSGDAFRSEWADRVTGIWAEYVV